MNTTRRLLTAFRSSGKFRPRTVKELKKRLDDIGDAVAFSAMDFAVKQGMVHVERGKFCGDSRTIYTPTPAGIAYAEGAT